MRIVSFLAASSLALITGVAAADPVPEVTVAPPAGAPAAGVRGVIVIHDDGWKPGGEEPARTHRKGLLIGGLAAGAAGLAGLVAGASMITADGARPASSTACRSQGAPAAYLVYPALATACTYGAVAQGLSHMEGDLGHVVVVAGGLVLAGGVAMAIVGGWQVPLTAPSRAQQATGVPTVTVSPQRATLAWTL